MFNRLLPWCIAAVLGITITVYFINEKAFRLEHVTTDQPFQIDWEITKSSSNEIRNNILNQPFHYLGEGGQAYAFGSSDGHYVIKFFKFQRFRPNRFIEAFPNIGPFISFRSRHISKRQSKMVAAFSGYLLAYEQLPQESGLIWLQLNPSKDNKIVELIDQRGKYHKLDLNNVSYVLQVRGEELGTALANMLNQKNLPEAFQTIDKPFALFRAEFNQGIRDMDHGIMHNIGYSHDGTLFHLDVGKLIKDSSMKNALKRKEGLKIVASKIDQWTAKFYPEYREAISNHINQVMNRQ
jgi:hypothetical protein